MNVAQATAIRIRTATATTTSPGRPPISSPITAATVSQTAAAITKRTMTSRLPIQA